MKKKETHLVGQVVINLFREDKVISGDAMVMLPPGHDPRAALLAALDIVASEIKFYKDCGCPDCKTFNNVADQVSGLLEAANAQHSGMRKH